MAITSDDLLAWLGQLPGLTQAFSPNTTYLYPGPYIPKAPDQIIVATAYEGRGYWLEGAADEQVFQARVRGPEDGDYSRGYASAESLAFLLDTLIFNAGFPVQVGGRTIIQVVRSAGPPAPLGVQPDDADRWTFICNYILKVGN